jgi:hypothetical protein
MGISRYNSSMPKPLSPDDVQRLEDEKNLWVATVRPDARPHLTPVWFAWYADKFFICIQEKSVKARNLLQNPKVSCAIEDGDKPIICEGLAVRGMPPWPQPVAEIFQRKYDWDIHTDKDYNLLLEITPEKWLVW